MAKFYVVLQHGSNTVEEWDDLEKTRMTAYEAATLAKKIARTGVKVTVLESFVEYSPAEPHESKL